MNENDARRQRDVVTVRLDEPQDLVLSSINLGVSSIIGTRKNQQDSVYSSHNSEETIAIVCDGMGGMEGGELASQLAIKTFVEEYCRNSLDIPSFYEEVAKKMDRAVASLCRSDGELMHAGTTVVATIVRGNKLHWLTVGDSRIYILRGNEIIQVNRDHNYKLRLDAALKAGDIDQAEYQTRMKKGEALISYIGIGNVSLMDINPMPFILEHGDVVLLCSDGLYKRLDPPDIQEIILRSLPDVDAAATALTTEVMKRTVKSQDNTSVILIQYSQYSYN